MSKRLFLLDGMPLVYRSHFALMSRPIFTSKGFNTSALYGFTQTLLEIIRTQQPTHIVVAFDTEAPTPRHLEFPDYKVQREAMPEELSQSLPHVRRMIEAFNIPVITCDGCEADDIIGTVVRQAEKSNFVSYMVTPDKDFGQLVSEKTFLYKPSRMGEGVEILGLPEILKKWGIQRPEQVIDIMALWGDVSDNIPGVPGIGEKTASKLISQYGTVENLLAHTAELKGRVRATLEQHREQALLSKRLATIRCDAPIALDLGALELRKPDDAQLKSLFNEFEFNSLGRRLYGDGFKTLPSRAPSAETDAAEAPSEHAAESEPSPIATTLQAFRDIPRRYRLVLGPEERRQLIRELGRQRSFAFATETIGRDPKQTRLIGLAFSFEAQAGFFVPLTNAAPPERGESSSALTERAGANDLSAVLNEFRDVFENERIQKVGHNLKFQYSVLRWHGVSVRGPLFDTMLAHSLIEPEMRHSLQYLAEVILGYAIDVPVPTEKPEPDAMLVVGSPHDLMDAAVEKADLAWQLQPKLEELLKEKGQVRVYYEIEAPLLPVLVDMECEGIRVEASALAEFAQHLSRTMIEMEKTAHRLAGREFNLNSPRQLGEILFDELKLDAAPKKTKTGQYATDEQTLLALAPDHEIVQRLLSHRVASKLKSTYADALPATIWTKTGRIHTTYNQAITTTGRLQSQDPNLQNIPIRAEQGREIRKAFVPRSDDYLLLSADYSQIELRIIAALSKESAMIDAFEKGQDIHTATAARVYGVALDAVNSEMRRKAKMVNYGIAYGISAFGLAQRLGIPRQEAANIIEQYFAQFPGIKKYMSDTVAFARTHGYAETVTGRRRYLRDIRSANATIRNAAERNAINAPIQGTAADMIKIAMANIHQEILKRNLQSRMLLQVHDELVFDLFKPEQSQMTSLVKEKMQTAISLDVPIVIEVGLGKNWLEAH